MTGLRIFFIIGQFWMICWADSVLWEEDFVCPENCQCDETKINCTNLIPHSIPKKTTEVIIFFTQDLLFPRAFCNATWPNVTTLSIADNRDYVGPDFHLVDNVFLCLENLEILKIQIDYLPVQLYSKTFAGLTNVLTLDFTNCARLESKRLYYALSEKTMLPKLSHLVLIGVSRAWGVFKLTQNFINVLGDRKIVDINLSLTAFSSNILDMSPICDTLMVLNLSKSIIADSEINDTYPCHSLRTIDISETRFPKTIPLPPVIKLVNCNFSLDRLVPPLYQPCSKLFAKGLISSDHMISVANCTLDASFENALEELHITGYRLTHFDFIVKLNPDHMKYLDLSSNKIETIGTNIFKNLPHIVKIDLSKNEFSKCTEFDETFSVLFRHNTNLADLNIADSGLPRLPSNIFSENKKLKYLNLAHNAFEHLTFNISHLRYLTLLDLTYNKIESLDKRSMQSLDHLYKEQRLSDHNQTLLVDLRGNPFSCRCTSLEFITWFAQSPIFTSTRHLYHCLIEGKEVTMDKAAIAEAKEDCEKPIRRRRLIILTSVIPALSIAIIIFVTSVVVRTRRRSLFYNKLEDTVKLLREDSTGFQFPIFLSYSSEDQRFVLQHILDPLQHHLQSRVGTDRTLICIGDTYFRPGYSLFTEITRCLENCGVVVAVMSKNYCRSFYCQLEIQQARITGKSVIMIFIEDVEEAEMTEVMKEVFRNFTRVKIVFDGGHYHPQPDWPCICQSVLQLM